MPKEKYVTIAEFARRVNRSERIVRYWIDKGLIQYERNGLSPESRIVIPMKEVDRVIKLLPQGEIIETA